MPLSPMSQVIDLLSISKWLLLARSWLDPISSGPGTPCKGWLHHHTVILHSVIRDTRYVVWSNLCPVQDLRTDVHKNRLLWKVCLMDLRNIYRQTFLSPSISNPIPQTIAYQILLLKNQYKGSLRRLKKCVNHSYLEHDTLILVSVGLVSQTGPVWGLSRGRAGGKCLSSKDFGGESSYTFWKLKEYARWNKHLQSNMKGCLWIAVIKPGQYPPFVKDEISVPLRCGPDPS